VKSMAFEEKGENRTKRGKRKGRKNPLFRSGEVSRKRVLVQLLEEKIPHLRRAREKLSGGRGISDWSSWGESLREEKNGAEGRLGESEERHQERKQVGDWVEKGPENSAFMGGAKKALF